MHTKWAFDRSSFFRLHVYAKREARGTKSCVKTEKVFVVARLAFAASSRFLLQLFKMIMAPKEEGARFAALISVSDHRRGRKIHPRYNGNYATKKEEGRMIYEEDRANYSCCIQKEDDIAAAQLYYCCGGRRGKKPFSDDLAKKGAVSLSSYWPSYSFLCPLLSRLTSLLPAID